MIWKSSKNINVQEIIDLNNSFCKACIFLSLVWMLVGTICIEIEWPKSVEFFWLAVFTGSLLVGFLWFIILTKTVVSKRIRKATSFSQRFLWSLTLSLYLSCYMVTLVAYTTCSFFAKENKIKDVWVTFFSASILLTATSIQFIICQRCQRKANVGL